MKNTKETKSLFAELSQTETIKHSLINLADNCKRLSEEITTNGNEELNTFQKQLIRLSAIPMIQETIDILLIEFMKGEKNRKQRSKTNKHDCKLYHLKGGEN